MLDRCDLDVVRFGIALPLGYDPVSYLISQMGISTKSGNSRSAIGRPRNPVVDQAILRAALELFIEQGIVGASIEKIAKRAGVAKTSVYRRWSSREALLAQEAGTEDIREILARTYNSVGSVLRGMKGKSEDALRASLRAHALAEQAARDRADPAGRFG